MKLDEDELEEEIETAIELSIITIREIEDFFNKEIEDLIKK